MRLHRALHIAGILLITMALTGSLAPSRAPAPGPGTGPERTLPVAIELPALGLAWSGKLSIDRAGIRLAPGAGLRWDEEPGGPLPGDGSWLSSARRGVRLLRAVLELPAQLARGGVRAVIGPAH